VSFTVGVAEPTGWKPPDTCDQCPHSIKEHVLFEPDVDEQEDGWMFCGVKEEDLGLGCKTCWHSWSFVDGHDTTNKASRKDPGP
jgi:hypothetical protein